MTPRAIHGTDDEKEIQSTNSSTHIEEELSDSDSEVVVPQKPRQKQKRIASSESEDDCGTIHSSDVSSEIVCVDVLGKKRKMVKTEDDSMPLPHPFPLPKHYTQDIESALRRKNMSTKEKQRFISDVASAMLRFKRYPTHDDYLCVARSVVLKYPFIKTSDAKPYVSVVMYLVGCYPVTMQCLNVVSRVLLVIWLLLTCALCVWMYTHIIYTSIGLHYNHSICM